jgi:hypothetical protein
MRVVFVPANDRHSRLIAEATLVLDTEKPPLLGLRIKGFGIWQMPDKLEVTFPGYYDDSLVRSEFITSRGSGPTNRLRQFILDEFNAIR